MYKKEFYHWLDTIIGQGDADWDGVEVDSNGRYHVVFSGIKEKTLEEMEQEKRADELRKAIKSLEDILDEPYVLQGNAVQLSGKLYSDTSEGFRLALELLKGESR